MYRGFEEISGFEVFLGLNWDVSRFVPNSGHMPKFGTFYYTELNLYRNRYHSDTLKASHRPQNSEYSQLSIGVRAVGHSNFSFPPYSPRTSCSQQSAVLSQFHEPSPSRWAIVTQKQTRHLGSVCKTLTRVSRKSICFSC